MTTELLRLLADPAIVPAALIFAGCVAFADLTFWLGWVMRDKEVAAAKTDRQAAYAALGEFAREVSERQPRRGRNGRFKKKPTKRVKA